MRNNRQWSLSLMGIVSVVLLAAVFYLVGSSSALAADATAMVQQNPNDTPQSFLYRLPLTDPLTIQDNFGNLLGTGVVQGQVEGRENDSAEGQILISSLFGLPMLQLVFAHVDEILVDANQHPVGAVLSGRGTKNDNGHDESFDFALLVHYLPDGDCCSVQILAPEIHESGGIRFEGPGDLRFTSR